MIIKVNNDPDVLSNINLINDIIICFKNYKTLEPLKMVEVNDIDCDIFVKNIQPIKATNLNNSLQFDYSPKIKISVPINIQVDIKSHLENTHVEYKFKKDPILVAEKDLYFAIYSDINLIFKQIDIRNALKFNGNIIPIGNDLITLNFLYKVIDLRYTLSHDIYLIQNSMIYDSFPNFSSIN